MLYLFLSFVSGLLSGGITLFYRMKEIQTKTIIFGKHMITQIIFFLVCLYGFQFYFSHIEIVFPFITLSWIWIFIIVSSMSYYLVQLGFENYTGYKFYAPKEELEAYLEKLENERDKF